jgi:hypothetical protein
MPNRMLIAEKQGVYVITVASASRAQQQRISSAITIATLPGSTGAPLQIKWFIFVG